MRDTARGRPEDGGMRRIAIENANKVAILICYQIIERQLDDVVNWSTDDSTSAVHIVVIVWVIR